MTLSSPNNHRNEVVTIEYLYLQNERMFALRKKSEKDLTKNLKKISKKLDKQVALCEDPQIVPNLTGLVRTSNSSYGVPTVNANNPTTEFLQ